MRADKNPLTTLASLYVGASRHKDNLAIVTDDKEKLLEIISENLDLASETITFKEPPHMKKAPEKAQDPIEQTYEREISIEQDLGMGGIGM